MHALLPHKALRRSSKRHFANRIHERVQGVPCGLHVSDHCVIGNCPTEHPPHIRLHLTAHIFDDRVQIISEVVCFRSASSDFHGHVAFANVDLELSAECLTHFLGNHHKLVA